jgi:hypothetical protein
LPRELNLWVRFLRLFIHRIDEKTFAASEGLVTRGSLLGNLERGEFFKMYKSAELLASRCKDATNYFEAAQLVALVKKYRGVDPKTQSLDPEQTARDTWLASESKCRDTNELFLSGSLEPDLVSFLSRMKTYIRSILGDKPDLEEIYVSCDFSSGASIGVSGDSTHLAAKFLASEWTATPSTLSHFLAALTRTRYVSYREGYSELSGSTLSTRYDVLAKVKWVSGNKLSFVPKTMATHRAIAVEPLLNSFVQSGVDKYLRRLFKTRGGIDLTQQEPNQRLAREGSIDGSLATIDLSSASDTLSRLLVKYLLPYDWHKLLNEMRSPYTIDKKFGKVSLEKFCSMGNNFCFPLQSIIFASFCYAAGARKGTFRVYGDDIICPTDVAPEVLHRLAQLGFVPNLDKTFVEGPFRESCGADWWKGRSVRPAYCVKVWDDVRNVASFHNTALRLWPEYLHPILDWLRSTVPESNRFVRPYAEPDGGAFNAPLDECMGTRTVWWDRNLQNWAWKQFESVSLPDFALRSHPDFPFIQYLAFLRGASAKETFAFRRKTRTVVRACSRWPCSTPC